MRVVIVGAGDVGQRLARQLAGRHQVLLLDIAERTLRRALTPERAVAPHDEHVGLIEVHGDGTSRLVLQALFDPELHCALVAACGFDAGNLEAGRLAQAIGYQPVVAVQHDSESSAAYREAGITALDRPALLADQIDRSLKARGAIVPTGIGLGRGELVEINLQQTSPLIGRSLKDLAPYRWRVAAVFRDDALIVPTGDTELARGDRVLLVGDPAILPSVVDYLRLGTPQFPRSYGPNVVTLELDGADAQVAREAEELARTTAATGLVRGLPGAADHQPLDGTGDQPVDRDCRGDVRCSSFPAARPLGAALFAAALRQRPGLLVTGPCGPTWTERLLGRGQADRLLCDALAAPVLFARGRAPYSRILLPVSDSALGLFAAEVAIDLARQLGAALTAIRVDLPGYLSGAADEELHQEVVPVRKLCQLYELKLDYLHAHGNPVREIARAADNFELVVVARRHRRPDGFANPDVALRVARAASSSVLVLTRRPGE